MLGQFEGYAKDAGIEGKHSHTPTFLAAKTEIRLPEWEGVPVYLRAGKEMNEEHSSAVIQFKKNKESSSTPLPGRMIIRFSPDSQVQLDYAHGLTQLYSAPKRSAYTRILEHALTGNASFFLGINEILSAWKIVEPLLKSETSFVYAKGTPGPLSAEKLIQKDGRTWFSTKKNEN